MAILESLLRRLGYIKLSTYGFVLTPDNRVLPMLAAAPVPPEWEYSPTLTTPLPSVPIPVPGLPPIPPPSIPRPMSGAPVAKTEECDEDEWEWRMAMARAKGQTESSASARMARGTSPPPLGQGTPAPRIEPAAPAPRAVAASAPAPTPAPAPAPAPVEQGGITEKVPVVARPTSLRAGVPLPGIGRRLHSAIKTPSQRVGAAPLRVAPTDRTQRELKRIEKPEKPVLRAVPPTPPALPDPDTVVTQAAPAPARRPAAELPRLTKRLAATA